MRLDRGRALSVLLSLTSACSALDDVVVLPRCDDDADCALVPSPDPECLVFVCAGGRCTEQVADRDGDGVGEAACADAYCTDAAGVCASRDCDDADPAVRPGAPEVCNGIDDDCNGLLDGPDEDDDRDGHADSCAGAGATDCDDGDPFTFVGARERCDGLDNDCFVGGLARRVGGSVIDPLEDLDRDGHVSPAATCDSSAATDLPKDDCDDADDTVYPGAPELCDGTDNDCNRVPDDHVEGEPGTSCLPVDLSAGDAHGCVRRVDDSVVCWGQSHFKLAGTVIDSADTASAELVPGGFRFVDVSAGRNGTCGVLDTGQVRCWGSGEIVVPELAARLPRRVGNVAGVEAATAVVVASEHACALVPEGVTCWGRAASGAVDGIGGSASISTPAIVPGTEGATHVDTIATHTCAVVGGRVACWGDPSTGALGGVPLAGARVVWVDGIDDAREVAVGRDFTCVAHESGRVSCLGDASYSGTPCTDCPEAAVPRAVVGISDAVSVDAYDLHACALRRNGAVACWGANRDGQLGDGTTAWGTEEDVRTVVGIDDAVQIAVGARHSCARGRRGAFCWGSRHFHRLGDGRNDDTFRPVPHPVSVIRPPAQLAGGEEGMCFRMPDLSLRCAGAVEGLADSCYAERVERWETLLDLSLSLAGTCAITGRLTGVEGGGIVDRRIQCTGAATNHPHLQAAGLADVVPFEAAEPRAIAVGLRHACVLDTDGRVWCWGADVNGQLGGAGPATDACTVRRMIVPCALSPVAVPLDGRARAVASGRYHACALLADGRVQCWGGNSSGQLGRAPLAPVNGVGFVVGLPPDDPAIAVAAGGDTTCVVLASREAWCWGQSVTRQPSALAPRPLAELGSVEQLALPPAALDGIMLCARLTSGPVWCLGTNELGRLGGDEPPCTGSCEPVDEPVASWFSDATDVACADHHCCATRSSGQVVCWGDRSRGQGADGLVVPDFHDTAPTVDFVAFDPGSEPPACGGTAW